MSDPPLLEVSDLSFRYQPELPLALDQVSLRVEARPRGLL
jgi:hypothetical protein